MRLLAASPPNVSLSLRGMRFVGATRLPHIVVFTALLIGFSFAAPVDASPILVSGEYSLHIDGGVVGDPGYPHYGQTVTQSVLGDFSDSISEAVDVPPYYYNSAASVSFSMSDNRIEAVGTVAAYAANLWPAPVASAQVELGFTFSLTEAHLARVRGYAMELIPSSYSFMHLYDLPPDIDGDWGTDHPSGFTAVFEPGTYTFSGIAGAQGCAPCGSLGGSNHFSFEMDLAPIPEPSTFLLLAGGLAGLAAAGRRRTHH